MLLEINITSSCAYPFYKPHFRLRVLFWSRARTSKPFSPLYYYIGTVWWISQTFVVQQSSMWTGCEGLHERSVFWRTGSLWMCAPSTPHPAFFFFSLLLPYDFLEKTSVCSLEDRLHGREGTREAKLLILRHVLILCPTCSLTAAFSSSLCVSVLSLFPPSMLCVLTLLLSLALPLLNNKPSVCGAIFGPFKATKRSPLSCSLSLSLSLFPFSAAIWHRARAYRKCKLWWPPRIVEEPSRLTCFHVWCVFNPVLALRWCSGLFTAAHFCFNILLFMLLQEKTYFNVVYKMNRIDNLLIVISSKCLSSLPCFF